MPCKLPPEPLAFIKHCVHHRLVYWTYHVNMRMRGRHIKRQAIVEAVDTYEIIETYPADKYLPSYLILARYQGEGFHVLFATDVVGTNVRIITAYRPSPDDWEPDLKTRRPSR